MAKGKALKIKQYKVPIQKYLVVINPWGVYGNFDAADLNHIGAWFDTMLRDKYKETRIGIYFQRTHRNIIVELPRGVNDIEQYLGTHHYSKFFLHAAGSDDVAYIYEYNYASFGDPTDKTFTQGSPMYNSEQGIPPNFPIKYPYPLPSPAPRPPVDVPYARPIPSEVNARIADRLRDQTKAGGSGVEAPVVAVLSSNLKGKEKEISPPSTENFTPYVRPACLSSKLTEQKWTAHLDSPSPYHTKMDAYDKEERAESLLKPSNNEDTAHSFLASIITSVKVEKSLNTGSAYEPSAELLDALNTLPEDLIEPNVQVKAEEEYKPSAELLDALNTLSENFTEPNVQVKAEEGEERKLNVARGSSKRIKREE